MQRTSGHNPASIRVNNRRLVLDILRHNGNEMTVTQISRRIQLSKTTLWKIVDHFVSENVVVNTGKAATTDEGGKKPELYQFNEFCGYIISIAIYGTHILLALADANARPFYKEKVFIHEDESLERIADIVSGFIRKWQQTSFPGQRKDARLLGIAIASTGVVDSATGRCSTASRFSSWGADAPVRELIEKKVPFKAPFFIDNYNRFLAFAEKSLGKGKDKKNIIAITAGSDGVGAGIIAEGVIKRGPQHLTGEIGHMCLNPFDEEVCHCGGRGCFEQLVSGERLIKKAESGQSDHANSLLYSEPEEGVTLQKVFDAANRGDSWAVALIDDVVKWFAIGLHNASLVFNPEIIIIAGDYRTAGPYFLRRLAEEMQTVSLIRMPKGIKIVYSDFDEDGVLLGAASYVLHEHFAHRYGY